MTQFKEKGERQEFVTRRPLHLPGADGGRHPALPDRHRPDRRRPAPAPRARARHRRALQHALRRDVRRAEGVYPEIGARIMDLQEPTKKMSTTGGTPQGTVLMLDPPDVDPQEDQERRDRLGPRGAPRRREAGRHEPDRHHVRRHRRVVRRGDRGALRRRRLRPVQGATSPRRSSSCSTRSRRRYEELRADAGELRRLLARGAEKAAAAAAPTLEAMYERMGFVRL